MSQYFSDSDIIHQSTEAIREKKDVAILKTLLPESSREWCSLVNIFGNTLLQESILAYNTEAFIFLLPFQDLVTLEKSREKFNSLGETALQLALKLNATEQLQTLEFFAIELINYGAFIHGVVENKTLLDYALRSSSLKIAKLLLEKGININFQDKEGKTSLHKILCSKAENIDELVSFLLYYGVNPFIKNEDKYIPFEYAVKNNCPPFVQEMLFYYTFDEHTDCKIDAEILFKLPQSNSKLFFELYNNEKVKFIVREMRLSRLIAYFESLFEIDIEYLNFILDKFHYLIREILIRIVTYHPYMFSQLNRPLRDNVISGPLFHQGEEHLEELLNPLLVMWKRELVPTITSLHIGHQCLTYIGNIEHLSVLFESRIKSYMLMFLNSLSFKSIFIDILQVNNETDASTLLIFLLSYGLYFTKEEYDEVYLTYGYCDLFKLMLLIGSYDTCFDKNNVRSPMCRLICDINLSLDNLLLMRNNFIHAKELPRILDYFVDAKLSNYLLAFSERLAQDEEHRRKLSERLEVQPKVPLLVELSRNVFRKYVIEKFKIKNERQFHFIINWLPVSTTHKKIITYETQLY